MGWLEQFAKLTEVKARYFFAVWVFGALLIFLPPELKDQMGVTIPETVRPWVGFTTLATFVLWLVLALVQLFAFAQNKFRERERKSEILDQLETLSRGERDVLLQCLDHNQRTIYRNITDGSINSLKSKRLLVMASQGSALSMPHTIPKFVWDHLKANEATLFPELFDETAMNRLAERQKYSWMTR